MKIIKSVNQNDVFGHYDVFGHWEKVEKIDISQRSDIISPIVSFGNLEWNFCQVEPEDIEKLFIISSDDWKEDGLCVPNFRLLTAMSNYQKSDVRDGKYGDIKTKVQILNTTPEVLDTKLILVSDDKAGPYTFIEGNRRAVALTSLDRLIGLSVYLGISPAIKNYWWSRHTYSYYG